MLHRLLNRARDLLYLPGLVPFWLRRLRGQVLCLLYHRVCEPGQWPFLTWGGSPVIAPEQLYRELLFLRDAGVRFLRFSDLLRGEFPDRNEVGIIISFDDGFRDVYTSGLAVLDQLGIQGVIFQATAMIQGLGAQDGAFVPLAETREEEAGDWPPTSREAGRGDDETKVLIWEHELYWLAYQPETSPLLRRLAAGSFVGFPAGLSGRHQVEWLHDTISPLEIEPLLERVRHTLGTAVKMAELATDLYPSVEQIQNAARRGHDIGSHGHRHYPRGRIPTSLFEKELRTSASLLESILGRRAACFSYPFNSHAPGDEAICGRYFNQVATVEAQPIQPGYDRLRIPRCTWPGQQPYAMRQRRWLLTGSV